MHSIITEELRFRKRVCEYAIKHGNNAEAARRYHTSRQQVQRWVKCFDGTIDSLRLYSRKYNRVLYELKGISICHKCLITLDYLV